MRAELARLGLDGFLVPRADRQQNEYVAPGEERLAWLTGFTGSAGLAVIFRDRAVLFVDGRYTLQVRDQVDLALVTPVPLATTSPEKWLEQNLCPARSSAMIPGCIRRVRSSASRKPPLLPAPNSWRLRPIPSMRSGPTGRRRRKAMSAASRCALPASPRHKSSPASPRRSANPMRFSSAIRMRSPGRSTSAARMSPTRPCRSPSRSFRKRACRGSISSRRKLDDELNAYLAPLATLAEPQSLEADLAERGRAKARILFDTATVPVKLTKALQDAGGTAEIGADPIALMKACKNKAELEGARRAQLRDAIAMVRFLHWFDSAAPKGKLTEIEAAQALETFRRKSRKLKDVSFPTISAAGPNSAIPHYRVTKSSNRKIGKGIFLIDSGGQYEDGTTDITRTLAVGRPSAEMRDRYTRVLKGNIAISRAVFPKGTSGAQLDSFAREALWKAGLDFDHGTGHGVGAYLSVHEGPQRIAKTGTTALEPGMIVSNEPGYYKAGDYGIRIENLVCVESAQDQRRRARHARLRDDDAGADRHAAHRAEASRPPTSAPGSTPIMPACAGRSGPMSKPMSANG